MHPSTYLPSMFQLGHVLMIIDSTCRYDAFLFLIDRSTSA